MVKRRLGKSDLEITPVGLGCWQFSRGRGIIGKYWDELAQKEINGIVETAVHCGINWFDTAESYGWGASETALAIALDQLPENYGDLLIATKWFPLLRKAGSLERTIEIRQEALKGYPIDLYQIHFPGSISPLSAQMKAMAKLLRKKAVRTVGVSNFSEKQMREASFYLKAEGFDLVSNQVRFNLIDRRIEANGILTAAKELGITLIAYSPLAQGILTGKYHGDPSLIRSKKGARKWLRTFTETGLRRTAPLVQELAAIGSAYGVSAAEVALNWVVHFYDETIVAIPGATMPTHAESNARAAGFKLTRNELDRLDGISLKIVRAV